MGPKSNKKKEKGEKWAGIDPIIYLKLACFTVSEIQIFFKTLNVVACDLAYLTMGLCFFAFLA